MANWLVLAMMSIWLTLDRGGYCMPHVRLIFLEKMTSCPLSTNAATDNKFFCTGATLVVASVLPRGALRAPSTCHPMSSTGFLVPFRIAFLGPCSPEWSLAVSGEITVTSAPEPSPNVTVLK